MCRDRDEDPTCGDPEPDQDPTCRDRDQDPTCGDPEPDQDPTCRDRDQDPTCRDPDPDQDDGPRPSRRPNVRRPRTRPRPDVQRPRPRPDKRLHIQDCFLSLHTACSIRDLARSQSSSYFQ
ncbi:hypothetical protein EOD39_10792 [Acipenser ruthenus]|uniref:Uncharacterized protein n=1 Tax=Acipenser ruthenus TaxID=7906 RepID=A0A444TWZ2_ACIRT|nr:hypothetical protein EOD39_10792 [Acipenser ruthenus]